MIQEDVRHLLDELGGQASVGVISARRERNLHTHVGQILQRLEKKEFVNKIKNKAWELIKRADLHQSAA